MKVVSWERNTGQGARHETQIWTRLDDGTEAWVPVSSPAWSHAAVYLGRRFGHTGYELEVADGRPEWVRAYHCSNSGRVTIDVGSMVGPDGISVPVPSSE